MRTEVIAWRCQISIDWAACCFDYLSWYWLCCLGGHVSNLCLGSVPHPAKLVSKAAHRWPMSQWVILSFLDFLGLFIWIWFTCSTADSCLFLLVCQCFRIGCLSRAGACTCRWVRTAEGEVSLEMCLDGRCCNQRYYPDSLLTGCYSVLLCLLSVLEELDSADSSASPWQASFWAAW